MAQEDSIAELACETPLFMENVKTHPYPIQLTLVLLLAPGGIPADVRGGKLGFSSEKHRPFDIDAERDRKIPERKASSGSSKIIA